MSDQRPLTEQFVATAFGQERPLVALIDRPELRILMFHDSIGVLKELVENDVIDERTYVIFSFSWLQRQENFKKIAGTIRNLGGAAYESLKRQLIFLVNSHAELGDADAELDGMKAGLVNNAAFLDVDLYQPSGAQKTADLVVNSKPVAFKRHYLTATVSSKIFLSSGQQGSKTGIETPVMLEDFNPIEIHAGLSPKEVSNVVSSCRVGGIFSAEEGACYASLEYLLCGLPVVSTPSLGGRDEYYTAENSIICEPSEESVKNAVEKLSSRVISGELKPELIRAQALTKVAEFRRNFSDLLHEIFLKHEVNADAQLYLDDVLNKNQKIYRHRNSWVEKIARINEF